MGSERDHRQQAVFAWALETFGDVAASHKERALRFLEEALELAQAIGLDAVDAEEIVDHVFSRARGNIRDEMGSAGLTLLCLAESLDLSADATEIEECLRVRKIDRAAFRKRQDAKAALGLAGPCGKEGRDEVFSPTPDGEDVSRG